MPRGFILNYVITAILLLFSLFDAKSQIADINNITVLDELYLTECGKPNFFTFSIRSVTGTIYSIKITDSLPEQLTCTITSALGQEYMTFTSKNNNQIPVANLLKEIYLLQLEGYQEVIKFTKS